MEWKWIILIYVVISILVTWIACKMFKQGSIDDEGVD